MSWVRRIASRTRGLFGHDRQDRELDEEVRFHLDMQVEEHIAAGMNPADARSAAFRGFGAVEPMKEDYRDRRAFAFLETIAQDLRYAVRTLRKSPGYTLTCVATLALAIGANTAMFSVLNAVLFRPLPYRNPEQLAMLWTEVPSQNVREGRSTYLDVEQWRRHSRTFVDIAFYDGVAATLTSGDAPQQLSVVRTSANLFSLLGIQPMRGRVFSAEEVEARQRLAVISHRFWQARFAGSADVIGSTIELDGRPSEIIGVLPAGFPSGRDSADLWEPHTLYPDWDRLRGVNGGRIWYVMGRLHPGVTFEQAQAEMRSISANLDRRQSVGVVPLALHETGPRARLELWMLAGAILCVLLIAATNVAGLSLARAVSREREIAVRAALGASRARIVRQLLAESLTLTFLSGLVGIVVALIGVRVIVAFHPGRLSRLNEAHLDPQVLAWLLALCVITGMLIGLAPAMTLLRRDLRPSSGGGRSVSGGTAARSVRRVLIVSEFALAIVLLAGAGLLIRSLRSAQSVDPGFRPERVLSMQIAGPRDYSTAQRVGFLQQAVEDVQSLPGVERAGLIGDLFVGGVPEQSIATHEGPSRLRFRRDEVSAGFFEALGTPVRGRSFSSQDREGAPLVAMLNETMARRLWPGGDALGKGFRLAPERPESPWFTVIGVVGDMRRQGVENEPVAQMFEHIAQNPSRLVTLLVRTSGEPLALSAAIQAAVRRVDKNASLYGVTTLESRLGASLAERRFQASLLTGFSAVALLMACIGIYGLIQYSVATRTREVGIRVAVGAQDRDVFRLFIREGLALSLTGGLLGLAGALWLGRAGASLLFGVTPGDPLTFFSVAALLAAVAGAACFFPARRAMKIEPMAALRQE